MYQFNDFEYELFGDISSRIPIGSLSSRRFVSLSSDGLFLAIGNREIGQDDSFYVTRINIPREMALGNGMNTQLHMNFFQKVISPPCLCLPPVVC